MQRLRTIFGSFFRIGLFTFGGGYAMIPIIEHEVIERRRWIARREFLDLLTLAQSVPGPISLNTAVFVGYTLRGVRGALAALVGVVLPSFVIILLLALSFSDLRQYPVVDAAFRGMRPAVVALIVGPVISLTRGLHWSMYLVVAAAGLLIWGFGLSPVYLLVAGAIGGLVREWYRRPDKRDKKGGAR